MIVEFKKRPRSSTAAALDARKSTDVKQVVPVPPIERAANAPSQPAAALHLMLPKPHRSIW